jgi:hypothetical protein
MKKSTAIAVALGATFLCAVPVSFQWSPQRNLSMSVDSAYARIGHPATPGSVAGVHRRATRRAVRRCVAGVCHYVYY